MPKKRKTQAAAGQKALPHVIFAPHQKKKGRITLFSITKTESIGATVGIQFVTFEYQDLGGPSNLLPGFTHRAHERLRWPKEAGAAAVFLSAFDVGFYDEKATSSIIPSAGWSSVWASRTITKPSTAIFTCATQARVKASGCLPVAWCYISPLKAA